jgi:hypothetical protein
MFRTVPLAENSKPTLLDGTPFGLGNGIRIRIEIEKQVAAW